jgi:hypothetical protein
MMHCRICEVMWEEFFLDRQCWVDSTHDGIQGFLPAQAVPYTARLGWGNLNYAAEVHQLTAQGWV